MHIGFLGHNGFALGDQEAPVLVDPLLLPRFGEEYTSSPVEVYPPREFDLASAPRPAAVLVSHEHSDHFHLPSLNKLDRSVPVLVGPLMIDRVVESIEALGFTVTRVPFGQPVRYGSVLLTLYPPGPDTVLWESRVTQVYVRDAEAEDLGGLYLSIDALLSEEFVADVSEGHTPAPRVMALSNNAQVTPNGVFGSLDVMRSPDLAEGAAQRNGFAGLDILAQLLTGTVEEFPEADGADFLICGGGFLKDYEAMGPFPFSEQKELAEAAQTLTRRMTVLGPEPGDLLELSPDGIAAVGHMGWVGVDRRRFDELRARREKFLREGRSIGMRRITRRADTADELADAAAVERELPALARAVLLSELGRDLLGLSRTDPELGNGRMVLKLVGDRAPDRTYVLDVAAGAFRREADLTVQEALRRFPYGIVVHTADLAAVFGGELQIWDIVGVAMRSWYRGDSLRSPVALLYDLYGEQVSPHASCRVYDLQLATIGEGRE